MPTSAGARPERAKTICIIDDDEAMRSSLRAVLARQKYVVVPFETADAFFAWFSEGGRECDLIVSDINMPGMSGYELCRAIRAVPSEERVPIILVTGSDPANEKATGLESGADDFIQKPFQSRELLAKIGSLLEIRESERSKLEKLGRLTRFLSPSVARLITSDVPQQLLVPHRVDVTVLFADLRRFTAFSSRFEPEEVMDVLARYYTTVGEVLLRHGGTIGHLAGDGVMAFFNDPEPVDNHQEAAARAAVAIREALAVEKKKWTERGYDIDFGIGLAEGFATIGGIGFDRFWQYSVIGPAANLAARLCQAAGGGQILVSQRFLGRVGAGRCETESLGTIPLKGIDPAVAVYNVLSVARDEAEPAVAA